MTLKQSTINGLFGFLFLLVATLLGGTVYYADQAFSRYQFQVERQAQFKQLGLDLAHASDYLTDQARLFTITGSSEHLRNYWNEIEQTRTRDKAVQRLRELDAQDEELELLALAKHNSDALVATEVRAMRLMLESQRVPTSAMPPAVAEWALSAADAALDDAAKQETARRVMADPQYHQDKRLIMAPLEQFQQRLNRRAAQEVGATQRQTRLARQVLVLVSLLAPLGIGLTLWLNWHYLGAPMRRYTRALQQRDSSDLAGQFELTPQGSRELQLLAQAFNHEFAANQRQLRINREIIKDVVYVSRSLAMGQLDVVPKAQYPGEFRRIREALESVLASLRQMVGDTVNAAQTLAEGAPVQVSAAYYPGDLGAVHEALLAASAKLVAAMERDARDNWVKTGHARLNEVMRGEQATNDLAANILTFLCRYQEALVGAFYLLEVDSGGETTGLKLVASYAYTWRKGLAKQYQVGEGLVGQAALERQHIILNRVPADYVRVESGLGHASPGQLLVLPVLYEDELKAVLEFGVLDKFSEAQVGFLLQAAESIGIALHATQSRHKMQELLYETQAQSEELQTQSEELQSQAEELRQTNEELEERTQDLERQKDAIRQQNDALEKTGVALELKAQELELASKYKSEFLANMSHELRTPLNSILILAQLLANDPKGNLDPKQADSARTIYSAGTDLLNLINDILDLSKVEAGKVELHPEHLPLAQLVDSIESKFRAVAEQRGLEFDISRDPSLPPALYVDPQRLHQVVNNLLSNAFKFTAKGGRVDLRLRRATAEDALERSRQDPAKTLVVSVQDSGIGISADKQQLIFEAFQQADGTTSRKYGGTGLGLSITRQLVRLMGGEIQLHSEEGRGSTFSILIPLQSPQSAATESAAEPAPAPSSAPAPAPSPQAPVTAPVPAVFAETVTDDRAELGSADKSLLIIEDDRKFLRVLMSLARDKGFRCLAATDGQSGLELAQVYKPNAVLLDIGLPQVDGWSVMERLKNSPETRHIPVHFMSAANGGNDARRMGAIGYLLKPVSVAQLGEAFRKIERFIERKVANLLLLVQDQGHRQEILDLLDSPDSKVSLAANQAEAWERLQTTVFDCIVLDVAVEQDSGIKLLERLRSDPQLAKIPVIIYAERELNPQEHAILRACSEDLVVKEVTSPERLLDEATLFLHQIESHLPPEKQKMLRMVHDKETVLVGKRALVVDDDMRNVFALGAVLESKGMDVVVANTGQECLNVLEKDPSIDVVLMDIMMPEMDGYEAMRRIRAQPQWQRLPIIALTAKAMKGDKLKCIEAGANDYLAKPTDTHKLLSLLRVWLYH